MRLDDGEVLELEARPNGKILVMWFLTKTITYSLATMFFLFSIMFFVNAVNMISAEEGSKESNTEIVQDDVSTEGVEDSVDCGSKRIAHPFEAMVEQWGSSLALVCVAAVLIQIYLAYLRRTYRYVITNRRCIFVGGILKRIERSVPYKKITDIQRSQNIIERMLGIWNVQVFTPGTASMQIGQAKARAELNFDGLTNSEEVYEAINKHTQLSG